MWRSPVFLRKFLRRRIFWMTSFSPFSGPTTSAATLAPFTSGRPSFVYPFHGDPDATWRTIREKGATHILIEPLTRDFLARTLAPHIEELEVVHAGPYRIAIAVRIVPRGAPGP